MSLLPSGIGQLTDLETLNLDGNGLRELPVAIAKLTSLTELGIAHNAIKHLPFAFGLLVSSVLELRLDGNPNVQYPPPEVWRSGPINVLDFCYSLYASSEETDSSQRVLKLDLHGLQLTSAGLMPNWATFLCITELDLSQNNIDVLPFQMAMLTNLVGLSISHNKVQHVPHAFKLLESLERLDLSHNPLHTVPAMLPELTRLAVLCIAGNSYISLVSADKKGTFEETQWVAMQAEVVARARRRKLLHAGQLLLPSKAVVEEDELGPDKQNGKHHINPAQKEANQPMGTGGDMGRQIDIINKKDKDLKLMHILRLAKTMRSLDLGQNKIKSLPEQIDQLSTLTILLLNNNKLHGLPKRIGGLVFLDYLDLSGNELALLPPEIKALTRLRVLLLDQNKLTSVSPEVCEIRSLKVLSVRFNNLFRLPIELGHLDLQELHVNNNPLVLPPRHIIEHGISAVLLFLKNFAKARFAEAMDLSGMGLRDLKSDSFGLTLDLIRSLDLGNNMLVELPDLVTNMPNLTQLNLMSNRLKQLPTKAWAGVGLRRVSLSDNLFETLPEAFEQLTALQFLDLSTNYIEMTGKELSNCPNMIELDLSSNCLREMDISVARCLHLQKLTLTRNFLTKCPAGVMYATELTSLDVSFNCLDELPGSINHLQHLKHLNVSFNRLERLPQELAGCTALEVLQVVPYSYFPVVGSIESVESRGFFSGRYIPTISRQFYLQWDRWLTYRSCTFKITLSRSFPRCSACLDFLFWISLEINC